jgi:copper chaperone CopZ
MKLDGVKKADVDWKKGEVVVRYDPAKVSPSQMTKAVNESGVFKVKGVEDFSEEKKRSR